MLNDKMAGQKQVANFLLGLGMGLVVGIVFHPQVDGKTRGLRDGTSVGRRAASGSVAARSEAGDIAALSRRL